MEVMEDIVSKFVKIQIQDHLFKEGVCVYCREAEGAERGDACAMAVVLPPVLKEALADPKLVVRLWGAGFHWARGQALCMTTPGWISMKDGDVVQDIRLSDVTCVEKRPERTF